MANLEAADKMTTRQLFIVLIVINVGVITAPRVLAESGMQAAWMIAVAGGFVFFTAAYLIIRLMRMFPGQSLADLLPPLVGRLPAMIVILCFALTLLIPLCLRIQTFSREITFFMFDRTPAEAIIITFLCVAGYCAVQDWGTTLRTFQIIAFTALPLMIFLILLNFINMQTHNWLPLWPPGGFAAILAGIPDSWRLFIGYEALLVLLAVTHTPENFVQVTGAALGFKTALVTANTLAVIGTLSAKTTVASPYPTMVAMRLVELPGTFVERLDNYFLLSNLPNAILTTALFLYVVAHQFARIWGYRDHRPFVLLLLPLMFIGTMSFHNLPLYENALLLFRWLGIFFSFGVIPLLLVIAWLQRRRKHE